MQIRWCINLNFKKFTVKNFNLEIFYDWFCGPGSHMSMHTNGNKHSITSNVKKIPSIQNEKKLQRNAISYVF